MAKRSLVRCKNEQCSSGILGAWADGRFYPSGHIVPGRNLYLSVGPGRGDAVTHVQCTYCGTWHEVGVIGADGRLGISVPVAVDNSPLGGI